MTPYYEDESVTLYHGDCRELLPSLAVSADYLCTDPPYGLDMPYGRGGRTIEGDSDMELLGWVWTQAARCLRADRWVTVFTDWRGIGICNHAAIEAGLDVVNAVVWDKEMLGMGYAVRPQFEMMLVARKGDARTDWNGGNVWRVTRNQHTPFHPHEKPLPLMHRMMDRFSKPGDLVLDPFAGSGSTLRAAKNMGRRAVGIELDERYCQIAVERLAQGVLDLSA